MPSGLQLLSFVVLCYNAFSIQMVREGYCIISDRVGSVPCNTDSGPNIEKRLVGSNAILTSGRVQPPSATWTAGPSSPPLQNSLSNRMQLHDSAQSRLQNILSGVNFTMSGNSHSSPQPSHNLMQQMRSMQQWWQQGANKLSLLQYQVQLLRQRQEQELHSRVNLGASAIGRDIVPFNDRIQGIRNIDSGSSSHSNITGNNGSAPILSGGIVHWPNTLNSCNYLENEHMSGLNDKQLFGALSDHRLAALPKLNASQDLEGRGLICGLPTQRNAHLSAVTAKPDALDMRNMLDSHRETRAETSQQLPMVQQQEIRPIMLRPRKVANHVGSPQPLVFSQHDQMSQLSTHQLNPITMSALHQRNHGSISSGSGSSDVNSWTHGSDL